MLNSAATVALVPLKSVAEGERGRLLAGIAELQLAPGQAAFVGDPVEMAEAGLADAQRHPFVITTPGPESAVVGMGTLHTGAATDTGWHDDDSAILLRGFLVDHRTQGRGYGTAATLAAVELASGLAAQLRLPATGVVLGVNERNAAGQAAYLKAGFADSGRYLGGRSGPQRIMHKTF
ncbi:GNAT family N-acetyltransferase [Arthrobacter sp. HY1533]|uniref:GNAT family N-acetyltransferase n=1 Tax=Arthrobacter sp. HY1533 TaxID=2970919 RepID=UPI0022B9E48B|nr:GNAT family N-acetyltransferase [Arthrobacter sp. HY1533]